MSSLDYRCWSQRAGRDPSPRRGKGGSKGGGGGDSCYTLTIAPPRFANGQESRQRAGVSTLCAMLGVGKQLQRVWPPVHTRSHPKCQVPSPKMHQCLREFLGESILHIMGRTRFGYHRPVFLLVSSELTGSSSACIPLPKALCSQAQHTGLTSCSPQTLLEASTCFSQTTPSSNTTHTGIPH